MILLLIVLVAVLVISIIWAIIDDWYSASPIITVIVTGFILFVLTMVCIKFNVSSSSLTGYVYQRSESFGYVMYDLRFSQNAGTDSQPSFCVKAGSEADVNISKYVGTDTKVFITIPYAAFRISDNMFECSSFAILDKVTEDVQK